MKLAAGKDDVEGMLKHLRMAAVTALTENENAFSKMSPRMVIEIMDAEIKYKRLMMKLEDQTEDDQEEMENFFEQLKVVNK